MSAESNLAGLYPPQNKQIWNEHLNWMPIPVHTVPSEDDSLLKMGKACPNMGIKYKALLENEYFSQLDKNNSKLYEFLSSNLGLKINKFSEIERIYDTMTIEVLYNLTQPEWVNTPWGEDGHKVFPDEMKKWADLSYETPTYTQELKRLGTGMLFDALASQFEAVIKKKNEKLLASKMVMFFAHKSTITDLTHTLGTFRLASYASCLLFELWKKPDESHYVVLYYVDGLNPEKLKIKDCEENCEFRKFLNILQPIRMNEETWQEACVENSASLRRAGKSGTTRAEDSFVFIFIIGLFVSYNFF